MDKETWEALQIIRETLYEITERKLGDRQDTENINQRLEKLEYLLRWAVIENE